MKILLYGESPVAHTGLAQITRVICDAAMEAGHTIEVVAVNHFFESYDTERYPYKIYPCPTTGDKDDCKNLEHAREQILHGDYDVFFFGCDLGGSDRIFQWRGEARLKREFLSICYCPIDCDQVPADVFLYFQDVEISITCTHYGKSVINRYHPDLPISVIYHPCYPDVFYPLPIEEKLKARTQLFNITDMNTFIVCSVNRNQPRKDLGRLMMIFHEFHEQFPNSMLYMHAQQQDAGGDLTIMARSIGMDIYSKKPEVIFAPRTYSALQGFSEQTMNLIYNASDCFASTSTGEGWGLATTEAMCAECPVIVPRNTSNFDLIGYNEERGQLVKTGGDIDHKIFLYGMTCNPRDIVHSESMLKKLEHAYYYRLITEKKAKLARQWCMQYTKERIQAEWVKLFNYVSSII